MCNKEMILIDYVTGKRYVYKLSEEWDSQNETGYSIKSFSNRYLEIIEVKTGKIYLYRMDKEWDITTAKSINKEPYFAKDN